MKTTNKVSFKTENSRGLGQTRSKTISGITTKFAQSQNDANTAARTWEPLFGTEAKTTAVTNIINEEYDTSPA